MKPSLWIRELSPSEKRFGFLSYVLFLSFCASVKVFGKFHVEIARSLHNLGELYFAKSRYSQAKALYRRSIAILEEALGSNHLKVAVGLQVREALVRSSERANLHASLGSSEVILQDWQV